MKTKKMVMLTLVLVMTASLFASVSMATESLEGEPQLIISDDFESYDLDGTLLSGKDTEVGFVNNVWTTKWKSATDPLSVMGWDSNAKFGIVSQAMSSDIESNKVLKVESRAAYDGYNMYPAIIYQDSILNTANKYEISVDTKISSANAGVSIKFFIHNDGKNYYEIYFPGTNGVVYTKDGEERMTNARWQLRKKINGTTQILSTKPTTYSRLKETDIWNIGVTVNNGRISWQVKNINARNLYERGVQYAYSGDYIDYEPFNPDIMTGLALCAGGQGNEYVSYDNLKVYEIVLPKSIVVDENFERYSTADVNFNVMTDAYEGGAHRENGYIGINWSSKPFNSGGYGYGYMPGSGNYGISRESEIFDGVSSTNQVAVVEARSVWDSYTMAPMLLYNGTTLSPKDKFTISADINKDLSNAGHIVRFLAHTESEDATLISNSATNSYMNSYYEFYLPGTNASGEYAGTAYILTKVVGGKRTELTKSISSALEANAWNNLKISYNEGEISWKLYDAFGNALPRYCGSYTDVEPFAESIIGQIHIGASGNYNALTLWDNFKISLDDSLETVYSEPFNYEVTDNVNGNDTIPGTTWTTRKENFGYDGNAVAAIVAAPANGEGNVLKVESRSAYDGAWCFPTITTSDICLNSTEDYTYTIDLYHDNGTNGGGGIRVNVDGESYYELFLQGGNGNSTVLTKSIDGTRTALAATITGDNKVPLTRGWHKLVINVNGGEINWKVINSTSGLTIQTGTYSDEQPFSASKYGVTLFASGQGGEFTYFDNLLIEKAKAEATSPIYTISGTTLNISFRPAKIPAMASVEKLQIILAYYNSQTNELLSADCKTVTKLSDVWDTVSENFTVNSTAGSYGKIYIWSGEVEEANPVWTVINIE